MLTELGRHLERVLGSYKTPPVLSKWSRAGTGLATSFAVTGCSSCYETHSPAGWVPGSERSLSFRVPPCCRHAPLVASPTAEIIQASSTPSGALVLVSETASPLIWLKPCISETYNILIYIHGLLRSQLCTAA